MNRNQEQLYRLLEEVDKICRDNNIVYYLAGGAALGAVRGGGFMPWDDDIDLYVTRKEWEKVKKAMAGDIPANRKFVCIDNDPLYGNSVGRYVDTNTTVMMKSMIVSAKACGQMIEFFVFDPMPKSAEGKKHHMMLVKTYTELLSPYFLCNKDILYKNPEFSYDHYSVCYEQARKEGMDKVMKELLDEITSVPEEESDAWYMCWARINYVYRKEYFGTPRYVKFERGDFPVPARQECVARVAYGDSWMYIPHVQEQISHDLDGDLDISFQDVVDLYMPLLDKEKVYETFEKRKRMKVDAFETWSYWKRDHMRLWLDVAGKPVKEKCSQSEKELRAALDRGDYDVVEDGIKDFMAIQQKDMIKRNGLILPVSDDFLATVVSVHVRTGKYYAVSGIVKARIDSGKEIPEVLQDALNEFDYSRALSIAVYDDFDIEKVEALIEDHPEYKDSLDSERASLWAASQRACSDEDYSSLLEKAEAAEQRFPGDGELMRFTALALYKVGREEEAREKYTEAVKNTRNGYVWREADENCGVNGYEIAEAMEAGSQPAEDDDADDDIDADDDKDNGQEGEYDEEISGEEDPDYMAFRDAKLKELLFEIDDICRENGLKYSLIQKCAKFVQEENSFPEEFNNICIAMPLGDLERLEHLINDEGDGSRIVENIHNNPYADNLSARYMDTQTTLIDFDDYTNHTHHGLFIDIRPIKQYDPKHMARPTYNFYRKLWITCCKNRDKKRSSVKKFAVDALKMIFGENDLPEKYYRADRDVSMVDSWEDIKNAPAIKCGAFSIRKEDYYNTSYFETFSLERNWEIEDRVIEGHTVMYCPQFYSRHVIGGLHGNLWAVNNQIVSPEPYETVLNDKIKKKIKKVLAQCNKYKKMKAPILEYEHQIDDAWNVYLMAKDLLLYEMRIDDGLYSEIHEAIAEKDKQKFIKLMEDYFTFLITYGDAGCPVVQIPALRQCIVDAIEAFYPGMKASADVIESEDLGDLIAPYLFPHLDESDQLAGLIKAAGTGEWDLKDKKDRKEGEVPFIRSEISVPNGLLS